MPMITPPARIGKFAPGVTAKPSGKGRSLGAIKRKLAKVKPMNGIINRA